MTPTTGRIAVTPAHQGNLYKKIPYETVWESISSQELLTYSSGPAQIPDGKTGKAIQACVTLQPQEKKASFNTSFYCMSF